MALEVYNVLRRTKEPFEPLHDGKVNMYVCGPTVYDHAHIGHAKTYVSFDVIVRYLRFSGYDVLYVQNLTDVGHLLDTGEDRILRKARQAQAGPMQIVETYARSYFEDMDALGVLRPDISPRATGHVPEQIKMIKALIEKGHAYVTKKGDVYFDVTSFPEYGKLSGQRLEDLLGKPLKESPHEGAEFVDAAGTTYDALGKPAASKYWNPEKFFKAIEGHLVKSNDFTVIDLTGFTPSQIAEVKNFLDGLSQAQLDKIIRIGL